VAFVIYPAPPATFDYAAVGVPADFPYIYSSGLLAHFNKNANLAWAFDTWFLNLFPRQSPFVFNEGGWSTLSFIPTLATMMMGMWAGAWLKSPRTAGEKLKGLLVSGAACTVAGLLLQWLQICPIVKRIWTSSYTLFSGGLILLMLAGFYAAIDLKGWKRWSFPLMVIGANSIAIYVISWTMESFVSQNLTIHFWRAPFQILGAPFEPVLHGIGVLIVFWLILYWMYKKRIFIKI
jgi:predicted acyltransferase